MSRTKANVDEGFRLVELALASLARTKRTRTKAYKLLLNARSFLADRATVAEMDTMFKRLYPADVANKLNAPCLFAGLVKE